VKDMDVLMYVVKVIPNAMNGTTKDIEEIIPNCKFMLTYRNFKPSILSVASLVNSLPILTIVMEMDKVVPYYWRKLYAKAFTSMVQKAQGFPDDIMQTLFEETMSTQDLSLMQAMQSQAICLKVYQLNSSLQNDTIAALKYEHLVANPSGCLEVIFKHCGLAQDLVEPALLAFNSDSQENSLLSMAQVTKKKGYTRTIDDKFEEQMKKKC
jgi:hypothetical protein